MKTLITRLPDDIHKAFKLFALTNQTSMQKIVETLIITHIGEKLALEARKKRLADNPLYK